MKILMLAPPPDYRRFRENGFNLDEFVSLGSITDFLIIELIKRGHTVHLISMSNKIKDDIKYVTNNLKIDIIKKRTILSYVDFYHRERIKVNKILQNCIYDICCVQWMYEYGLFKTDTDKTIIVCRDWPWVVLKYFPDKLIRIHKLLLFYTNIYKHKYFLGNSIDIVDRLRRNLKKYNNKTLLGHVYNGLNFTPSNVQKKNDPIRIVLINNGVNKLKNVHIMSEVINSLSTTMKGIEFIFIGKGYSESSEFCNWFKKNNTNQLVNCLFLGHKSHKELLEILKETNILIHPSKYESFGNILIEGIMTKNIVIAGKKSGAVPEILNHGEFGELVDIENPISIKEKLEDVINNYDDYYKKVDNYCKIIAEKFSITKMADGFENYFIAVNNSK